MRADQVIKIFEDLNGEGRPTADIDLTCAGLACWLGNNWSELNPDDIRILTSVGAVLWREGFKKRA
jgi:hypothetical protein